MELRKKNIYQKPETDYLFLNFNGIVCATGEGSGEEPLSAPFLSSSLKDIMEF